VTPSPPNEPTYPRYPWRRRIPLAAEILRAYPAAYRTVRSNDLHGMVAVARRASPARAGMRSDAVTRSDDHEVALRIGRATLRTLALVPTDARCLVRSLVVLRLLSRRGIESRLVIGVQPGPDFLAHAWVEHDGRPVTPEGTYARLMEA
jgi:hypothetical protein